MKLIVGGAYCGKEEYVRKTFLVEPIACSPEDALACPAILNLQEILKKLLEQDQNTDAYIEALISRNPEAVILCDEIGMGIVPLDRTERKWREATGRACCKLAEKADEVVRVVCGLPVVLKKADSKGQ